MKARTQCLITVPTFFCAKQPKNAEQLSAAANKYRGLVKKAIAGIGAVPVTLGLYTAQAQGSQSEAEAVAALCDAMRYQAYNTMEMRQLPTPKHELKDLVDRHMDNVNSRIEQYKLIDEAYMVELVSSDRAGLVAHEFAENQHEKCMSAQKDIMGL